MDEGRRRAARKRSGRGAGARDPRLPKPLADEVIELLLTAHRVLDVDALPHPEHVVDHHTARLVLTAIWEAAIGAIARESASVSSTVGAAPGDVVGLLRVVKDLDERVLLAEVRYRDQALHQVSEGLSRLGSARTTEELIDLASVTVCDFGFSRLLTSQIEDSMWIPVWAHVDGDERWGKEILEAGRANPQPLRPPLVEAELVRRKTAVLVDHVQERTDIHWPVAKASRSDSYCAAPVSVHGSVAGLLHVDYVLQGREVDESDRQVLSVFADGFGQVLSRTLVLDRLDAIRAELDQLSGQVAAVIGDADREAVWGRGARPVGAEGVARPGAWPATGFSRAATADPILTRREVDVLRLMAAGDTNARIARRLVISEGTVKSHVKHILRKLGASNRAEAVSHWLHMVQRAAPDRRPRS